MATAEPKARVEDLPGDLQFTSVERRVVGRLISALRAEAGEDLLAVWLFGSRARREADLTETDPDRRSDVDLMVVIASEVDVSRLRWDFRPRLEEIADAEADSPVFYSLHFYDLDRLLERRSIDSFFLREVDRDKVILFGDRLDEDGRR